MRKDERECGRAGNGPLYRVHSQVVGFSTTLKARGGADHDAASAASDKCGGCLETERGKERESERFC